MSLEENPISFSLTMKNPWRQRIIRIQMHLATPSISLIFTPHIPSMTLITHLRQLSRTLKTLAARSEVVRWDGSRHPAGVKRPITIFGSWKCFKSVFQLYLTHIVSAVHCKKKHFVAISRERNMVKNEFFEHFLFLNYHSKLQQSLIPQRSSAFATHIERS